MNAALLTPPQPTPVPYDEPVEETLVLDETGAPEETPAPEDALFALTLLADETAVDRLAGNPEGAMAVMRTLAGLITVGFAAHAVAIGLFLASARPPLEALHHAGAWFVAATLGFFIAVGAGLPSYWFHGVVARVPAPSWRMAVELLRVQAVGAVVLGAVLPFWLAATLGLNVLGAELARNEVWLVFSHMLPFLAAMPGVLGLYRAFTRMRGAIGTTGRTSPLLLTFWWVLLFQYTAPVTIYALFAALV